MGLPRRRWVFLLSTMCQDHAACNDRGNESTNPRRFLQTSITVLLQLSSTPHRLLLQKSTPSLSTRLVHRPCKPPWAVDCRSLRLDGHPMSFRGSLGCAPPCARHTDSDGPYPT